MAQETLRRTTTSTANKKVFTYSFWMKGNDIVTGNQARPIYNYDGSNLLQLMIERSTNTNPGFWVLYGSGANIRWEGRRDDPSAWYNIILSVNTTRTQDVDRVVLYIDGVRMNVLGSQTGSPGTPSYPALDSELYHGINYINGISGNSKFQLTDYYYVDGQALDGDVFGFNKEGDGYFSVGCDKSKATDFRPGQWSPHSPKRIKTEIERRGGFGTSGFYLPMNDSSNPGADFHCTPNSIIKLKGEDKPQPRNGAPTTSDVYVSQLREEPGTLGFDGAVKFDGVDDYISFAGTNDFAFGTGDFTVEFTMWSSDPTANGVYNRLFCNDGPTGDAAGNLQFNIDQPTGALVIWNGGGNVLLGFTNLCDSKWHHVAVTRSGTTIRIFVDGISDGSATDSTNWGTHNSGSPRLHIGAQNGTGWYKGLLSNYRILKGTALYTANFTKPTAPLTNITNTKLLMFQSTTDATYGVVTPGGAGTITANGGAFATKNELTGSIVLAVPGISTATGANLLTNGGFDTDLSGWTTVQATTSWKNGLLRIVPDSGVNGAVYQSITTIVGKRYTVSMEVVAAADTWGRLHVGTSTNMNSANKYAHTSNLSVQNVGVGKWTASFTATTTTTTIWLEVGGGSQTQIDFDNVVCKQEDAPRDYSADIRGSGSNLTLTANGNVGVGYELDGYYGSAINCSGTNADYLQVDTPVLGDGDWTIEEWITQKPGTASQGYWDVSLGVNGDSNTTGAASIYHVYQAAGSGVDGEISFIGHTNGYRIYTRQDIRDDAWHHVVVEKYNNVVTLYVDGVAKDSSPDTYDYNSTSNTMIGASSTGNANYFNGQITDVRVYAGLAKYKGGFDVPKPYGPVGIESWRTTSDTPTNNFATLNHLSYQTTGTYGGSNSRPILSNGNLTYTHGSQGQWERSHASFGVGEGKWYYEFQPVVSPVFVAPNLSENWAVGVRESDGADFFKETDGYEDIGDHIYWIDAGIAKIVSNQDRSAGSTSGITNVNEGDIINVAFEKTATTLKVWFGINGTYFNSGNPGSGSNPAVNVTSTSRFIIPTVSYYCYVGQAEPVATFNFGQNPSFSGSLTAGTNADDSGKGLFKYAPPSAFLSLCKDNLPTPTIPDPGKYFKTVLYSGDNSAGRRIHVGFKPDLIWFKCRNTAVSHVIADSVRGLGHLSPNSTGTENTTGTLYLSGYSDNGFDLGDGANSGGNTTGRDYVAWCWKAGGAAVTNNDGSITSKVSANQESGFSIVLTEASGTAGHGLNTTPQFIIQRRRAVSSWAVQHHDMMTAATGKILMETNAGVVASSTPYMFNANATTFEPVYGADPTIHYCWHEVEGFSRFSSYLGNGSSDGPFVYCGFRPAFVLIKNVDAAGEWCIWDSSRTPNNEMQWALRPNSDAAETDGFQFDFLSNGFKARDTESSVSANLNRYMFAAFAESPFQTANAK